MTNWRGVIYVGVAVALWSTAEVVIRGMHGDVAPIQLAWLRFTVGAGMMLALLPFDRPAGGAKGMDRRLAMHAAWMARRSAYLPSQVVWEMALWEP